MVLSTPVALPQEIIWLPAEAEAKNTCCRPAATEKLVGPSKVIGTLGGWKVITTVMSRNDPTVITLTLRLRVPVRVVSTELTEKEQPDDINRIAVVCHEVVAYEQLFIVEVTQPELVIWNEVACPPTAVNLQALALKFICPAAGSETTAVEATNSTDPNRAAATNVTKALRKQDTAPRPEFIGGGGVDDNFI